jgi:ATP-dependent DNA helicase Rep
MGVILKAANKLIGHNPHVFDKKLWSERGHGEKIRVRAASDEVSEAETIANDITHHHMLHTRKWSDYAILFRSNYQARP